ncbi:MAG: hypothetical protein Q8K32_24175 [Archangium sp.]|nr:hypothetical protein [Archangium sp.]
MMHLGACRCHDASSMNARTLGLISALLTVTAHAQSAACGRCALGAQCVAGNCQFLCTQAADCRHENVCVSGQCEPRLPVQRAGAPATIRRGDSTHPERFKESQPMPPGFHRAQEPHWEMVARGSIAFSAAYLPMAVLALTTRTPLMAVPLAGPILGYREGAAPFANAFTIAGIGLNVSVQLVGLCMAIAGFAKPARCNRCTDRCLIAA